VSYRHIDNLVLMHVMRSKNAVIRANVGVGKVWQGEEGRRRQWLDMERTVVIFVATLAGHVLWLEVIGLSLGAGVRGPSSRAGRR